ncbi:MAG TPA: hypothetical protein PKD49_00185 [Hyphomicrobium sp.]|nr:hypothetical protein [Hyphomicrobium sp.]
MLSNLILVVLQFVGAFLGAPEVLRFIPASGDLGVFVHAAVYAVLVWIIGLLASLVLKDVPQRSPAALALSLVLALIGAAVIVFVPAVLKAIPLNFPHLYVPLVLAILGYFMRR